MTRRDVEEEDILTQHMTLEELLQKERVIELRRLVRVPFSVVFFGLWGGFVFGFPAAYARMLAVTIVLEQHLFALVFLVIVRLLFWAFCAGLWMSSEDELMEIRQAISNRHHEVGTASG